MIYFNTPNKSGLLVAIAALLLPGLLGAQNGVTVGISFDTTTVSALIVGVTIYRGGVAGGDDSELVSEMTLPAELLSFGAQLGGSHVTISWATGHESQIDRYVLEYASDGVAFQEIQRHTPRGSHASYSVNLPRPAGAEAYFRLRVDESDGTAWYSSLEYLTWPADENWSFEPLRNPMDGNRLGVEITGLPAGETFTLRVFNSQGKTVHSGFYRHAADGAALTLPVALQPGPYFLAVTRADGDQQSQQVVVAR